jgi:choline dehydrogenase-like flavoprotein
MLRGLRLARQLSTSDAFGIQGPRSFPGRPSVRRGPAAYLRRAAATAHHPVGTCRRGLTNGVVTLPCACK